MRGVFKAVFNVLGDLERDDVVLGAQGELGDVLHAAVLVHHQDVVFPGVEL